MTLKEYAKAILDLAKDPELRDLPVIYSQDDEGNNFGRVLFHPNSGIFTGFEDFRPSGELDEDEKPTHICIN